MSRGTKIVNKHFVTKLAFPTDCICGCSLLVCCSIAALVLRFLCVFVVLVVSAIVNIVVVSLAGALLSPSALGCI